MTKPRLLGWPLVAAIAALLASRACLLLATPLLSDVGGYFQRAAKGVELGQAPYRDFVLEYPPAAWWCIALPRWLSSTRLPHGMLGGDRWVLFIPDYARVFRLEMLVFDLAAFLLLLVIVRRRRSDLLAIAAWTYVLLTTILGNMLLDRLDIGMLALLLAWAWSWLKLEPDASGNATARPGRWQTLGYAALGLGFSYKLIPGAIVPLALAADIRALRTPKDGLRLAVAWLVLAATAIGPFVWYRVTVGEKLWSMFTYHRDRGIEVESLWGTLALTLRWLGMDVHARLGYGSWNIACPIDRELLAASSVAIALILAAAIARACWPKRPFSRVDAYRWSLAVLVALMLAAKVLSVQFLLWGLPLLMLLGAELLSRRQFALLCAGLILVAGLSTAAFPYLFFGYGPEHSHALVPGLDWLPTALLVARNLLLAVLLIWPLTQSPGAAAGLSSSARPT